MDSSFFLLTTHLNIYQFGLYLFEMLCGNCPPRKYIFLKCSSILESLHTHNPISKRLSNVICLILYLGVRWKRLNIFIKCLFWCDKRFTSDYLKLAKNFKLGEKLDLCVCTYTKFSSIENPPENSHMKLLPTAHLVTLVGKKSNRVI